MRAYLEAENAYTRAIMQPTEAFQESLYQEMLARIKETDMGVPYRYGDFDYYSRTEAGKDYPIYCRRRRIEGAPEEIIPRHEPAGRRARILVSRGSGRKP